ncbi:TRAP transporter small permease [Celeribacter indicus]|uniref:Tripartite ATP-independent periplasmic transporter DctQ n=1 Tax=Celeribacter indicus TaxID=1208324 RepID=A0A0B5E0W7_9RHOB|nr:hypothetical protein [Celeribacter indicus]AJE46107.1 tripartite ATP-independent periplasmic transporter DctQ [Celeribacter indicus]SDX43607.1 hypothetical protein SAMN05443573_1285 [Celeribacter indicus]
MLKLANSIAIIGLTALLAVTGLVLFEVALRSEAMLALRGVWPWLDDVLFGLGVDGISDLYAPLGIVAVAACFPAMVATRSAITVRFVTKTLPWRLREGFEAMGSLCLSAMFALMAWWVTSYTLDLWRSGETTWLMELPRWHAWAVACLCLWVAVGIQAVVSLKQLLRACARHEPEPLPQPISDLE